MALSVTAGRKIDLALTFANLAVNLAP